MLVVSAWEPELAPLRRRLPARPRGLRLEPIGVGLVEAAAGAARAIARHRPAVVLFVGTAGVYRSARRRYAIGSAVVADRLRLASLAVARGDAYLPQPLPAEARTTPALRDELAGADLALADVACPLGITGSRGAATRLAATSGAALENLEAFAAARACATAALPFAAVLGVTNEVGPDAHAQWKANAAAACDAAAAAVAAWWTARARR